MYNEINSTVNVLPPFKKFCMTIGELPASYLETMSYYEMLLWFTKYLGETVIPTIDNNAEAVIELQNLFRELQNYVNNYFDNLDVQEEINNKLDDMVEQGTLQEIIAEYLNSKAFFGFNTVEEMKEATNLIEGSYAKTIGYYEANDNGGAFYKIVSSSDSYYEELDNGLYAELIVDKNINVKQLGAYGDGINDDAPFIRKAIQLMKDKNNNNLYFPAGNYYVNSGDERGLPSNGITTKNDYFSCFEVIDNMHVFGDGYSSIITYESNRLGYYPSENRGDVGFIFTNFRIYNNTTYKVNGLIRFENLKFIYTDLENGEKDVRDYFDGQFLRISNSGEDNNCDVLINNILVENNPGSQVINITRCNSFTADSLIVHNIGKTVNTANTDHSSFLISLCKKCTITNCNVYNDSYSSTGTAYELISGNTNLNNSTAKNLKNFMNAVPSTLFQNYFNVNNNTAENVENFINSWIYETSYTDVIKIENNYVKFDASSTSRRERIIGPASTTNEYTENSLAVNRVEIKNNIFDTNILDDTDVSSQTYGDRLINTHFIKNLLLTDNTFIKARRGVLTLVDRNGFLNSIYIANNRFNNICNNIPASANINYKSCIFFNTGTSYLLNNNNKTIDILNNNMNSPKAIGINFQMFHNGSDTKTKINIIDNNFITELDEIYFTANNASSNGLLPNEVFLKHRYSSDLTNPYTQLICQKGSLANLIRGSRIEGNFNGGYTTSTKISTFSGIAVNRTISYNTEAPSDGTFKVGDIVYNANSISPRGWICSASGSPGTWTTLS